jgi:hypothetical protein
MQNAVDLIVQLGQFALLVIVVCVAIMLLISFVDRHPRSKQPKDDLSPDKTNASDVQKLP